MSHGDWVRDVAWANNIGLSEETIASCCEDGTISIWRCRNSKSLKYNDWENIFTLKDNKPAWRVSWSQVGHMLAVSYGDNTVSIFKEDGDRNFKAIA